MEYKCINCGFIHKGDISDEYYCPLCGYNKNYFEIIKNDNKEVKYNRVKISKDNICINRIDEKCINCGLCFKTCKEIVGINYDSKKCDGICINCGQCVLNCPTGALTVKYDYNYVMDFIKDNNYKVIALTSPAVRVSIGDAFGLEKGDFQEGKMVAALKKLGFDYVFDTTFGADLTAMEEAYELKERIENNNLPMYSSCCPSWVRYVSIYHPELIDNLSTCKSPIGMFGTIISNYYAKEENVDVNKLIIVALTPCTSKKEEILNLDTDYVITTSELALMIRENNIDFNCLADEEFDNLFGSTSGLIFGQSGGVALSILRCLYYFEYKKDLKDNDILIEDCGYYQKYVLKIKDKLLTFVSVSTMINLEKLLKDKVKYDFCEVMNCDGGCIFGGGQILNQINQKKEYIEKRKETLNKMDKYSKCRYPYKNDSINELYDNYLGDVGGAKSTIYLHTKHKNLSYLLKKKL